MSTRMTVESKLWTPRLTWTGFLKRSTSSGTTTERIDFRWDRVQQNYEASGQNGDLDFWDFCNGNAVLLYIYLLICDDDDLLKSFATPIPVDAEDSGIQESDSHDPSTPKASSINTSSHRKKLLERETKKKQEAEKREAEKAQAQQAKNKLAETRNALLERQVVMKETQGKNERLLWLLTTIQDLKKRKRDIMSEEEDEMGGMLDESIALYMAQYKELLK